MAMGKSMAAAITAVGGALLLTLGLIKAPLPIEKPLSTANPLTEEFVVGEWQGRLAVFRQDGDQPEQVYEEVAVATLPPEERMRLRQGIPVSGRIALNKLLEDYTG